MRVGTNPEHQPAGSGNPPPAGRNASACRVATHVAWPGSLRAVRFPFGKRVGGSKFHSLTGRFRCLLVALLFAAPPASAEIYKCTDKSGLDRYQNFPCAIDSIGLPPPSDRPVKVTPPSVTSQAREASTPNAVEAKPRAVVAGEPRLGMTEDEVRAIWGEPEEIIEDEPRDGRIQVWRYGGGRSVQFSNKRRVLVVDR